MNELAYFEQQKRADDPQSHVFSLQNPAARLKISDRTFILSVSAFKNVH